MLDSIATLYRYRYVLIDAGITAFVITAIGRYNLPAFGVIPFLLAYLGMRHTVSRQHDREQRELAVRLLLENGKFHSMEHGGKVAIKALPVYRHKNHDCSTTGEIVGAKVLYSDGSTSESDVYTTPTLLGFMFTINPVVTRKIRISPESPKAPPYETPNTW